MSNLIDFPLANIANTAAKVSFDSTSRRDRVYREKKVQALLDIAAGVSIVLKQGVEFPRLPIPRDAPYVPKLSLKGAGEGDSLSRLVAREKGG